MYKYQISIYLNNIFIFLRYKFKYQPYAVYANTRKYTVYGIKNLNNITVSHVQNILDLPLCENVLSIIHTLILVINMFKTKQKIYN
jgi:hypothetical protein